MSGPDRQLDFWDPLPSYNLPSFTHGHTATEWHGMVRNPLAVLCPHLARLHIPRWLVLPRTLVYLFVKVYGARHAYYTFALLELVTSERGVTGYDPH